MSNNNKIILQGCIDQFKTENELTTTESETFELFSLTQITKKFDLSFDEIQTSICDGGNDGGIDSIIVKIDDILPQTQEDLEEVKFNRSTEVTIFVTQCKKESSFKESTIDKLITSVPELFNLESAESDLLKRFNASVVEKAILAREAWKKCSMSGGKLKIIYNYCSNAENIVVNNVFTGKLTQLKKITSKTFANSSVESDLYSCEELLKLFQTQKQQRLSLKYKETPLSTTYESFGFGYVGTVNLTVYKTFLTGEDGNVRDDLFESNVRHFQGLVDVNKKIKDTIENPLEEDFWWLNNGITIIASNPSLVGTTLSIDNIQIVNGLQTSYSIFYNHSGSPEEKRSVLVKVIINENKATIDHIIASTNSQSPVSATLLRATDEIQRSLELYFFNAGYFYDRRKNYYKNLGKPANKIFSIQSTAQSIETIINSNPHIARSKPTTLIKDDRTYDDIFDKNKDFKAYLNSCLIVKHTVDSLSASSNQEIKNSLSNFKLHLARIVASKLFSAKNYTIEDLIKYNTGDLTSVVFDASSKFLKEKIDAFIKANPETNLINMAKAKAFTEYFIDKL